MPKPAFALTDDQASVLVRELDAMRAWHADDDGLRDHRRYVRDFIRAVWTATGKTYSPAIYRRLLGAYAPNRRPSTTTLAQEKAAFEAGLDVEARAGRQIDDQAGHELALVIERAVEQALTRARPAATSSMELDARLAEAQRDFLQERLASTESQLEQARAQAARCAAAAQAAHAARDALLGQLDQANVTLQQQVQRVDELAKSLDAMRGFSLRAVDQVRGETRAWQERCAFLEAELQKAKQHAEYFRQIAYQRGAAIPPDLRPEPTK